MSKQKQTFGAFLESNEELVEEYSRVLHEDLWSLNPEEIESLAGGLSSKLKMSFKSVINNCINHAIETETTLIEVLEGFCSSKDLEDSTNGIIQKYFKEINKIYTDNDNNYDIPFCLENREKIISMNLKSVIAIAKVYQGLGVEFPDLISAGNEGLCKAFEKYDPSRACLKDNMISVIDKLDKEATFEELNSLVGEFLKYGEVKKEFEKKFKPGKVYSKSIILKWIDNKIQNAKFNSVACKWIIAYIINEINNNSRTVKKPKAEIDKDRLETGSYKKEVKVKIDAPINDDNPNTIGDMLTAEEDEFGTDDLKKEENYKIFKKGLNVLLSGIKSRDRRIILKKYGIGMLRPMQPNEIAIQEDLSVARISQIINNAQEQMKENAIKYKVDPNILFEALSNIL